MMDPAIYDEADSFRDSISTISKDGNRNWIFPKKPKGRFYNKRTLFSYFLLAVMFVGPFIKLNGHPFMLLNVVERKFILFGIAFWPQDFYLFVLAMLTFVVFIIVFTALFGRLWCGWACPQTIFMEMVFRKIEYWIEGDAAQQKALKNAPPSPEKFRKRILKGSIFFLISFIIANTFLAYIIGIDELKQIVLVDPSNHVGGLIAILVFRFVFFAVYMRFREQACLIVCPYGRLQGVLLDKNSVVIAYDYKRGEPRGKLQKTAESKFGDCIDCHQCVNVCPTGIDIRNGTQLECVNCTACIDACDGIMDKIKKPHGLIRYTSENAIAEGTKFQITGRIKAYSFVLFVLLTTLLSLLIMRSDVESTILRTPGMIYQQQNDSIYSNLYNVNLINKTFDQMPVDIKLVSPNGSVKWVGDGITKLEGQGSADGEFFVMINQNQIVNARLPIVLEVKSGNKIIETIKTNFIGPVKIK
ncbi:MAG: cytochrome c oxidase accessory protein CcoG [Bacteroidota bacterium]